MLTVTTPGTAPSPEDMAQAVDAGLRVVMVRNCGHEQDATTRNPEYLEAVGTTVSCWSACDRVPTWRGANNPYLRRVARYEFRTA